ncbi:hypothetical protein [Hydrogenophaga sp.]|uniref:hypothetical protein n=1 Tax=Hydrogenophaga sp. TaxID=1904254 RepID=UPI0026066D55|nr:hypothetical protein [Hydrogenophaga sp.]MCW5654746.1 hypothetical protein [Hydrogenophaga sp.]
MSTTPRPTVAELTPTRSVAPAVVDKSSPGLLMFLLSNAGVGPSSGWRIELLRAERSQGFRPQASKSLQVGEAARFLLWADRYLVRVTNRGDEMYRGWVEVLPDRSTSLLADIGLLTSEVKLFPAANDGMTRLALNASGVAVPWQTTFEPFELVKTGALQARYAGPQYQGQAQDGGELVLVQSGTPVLTVRNTRFGATTIEGDMRFVDGRTTQASLGADFQLPEGAHTTWQDGRSFVGSYQGVQPSQGRLRLADGRQWTGPVSQLRPAGRGRMTWFNGDWTDVLDGSSVEQLTGTFQCGGETVSEGQCYYFGGRKLASAQELAGLVEQQRLADEAARGARAMEKAAGATVPEADDKASGCAQASGRFVLNDDSGTVLTLQGRGSGSGHLRQITRGGATRYQFDIDFRFSATKNDIRFVYGEGTYREAVSGKVLQRMSVPSGTVRCSFDGQTLLIDNKRYVSR